MSKVCEITAKGPSVANNVSHAQNKTKTRQMPNLQTKTFFSEVLDKNIRIKLTTNALRTIAKHGGLDEFLKNFKGHKNFSPKLARARKAVKSLTTPATEAK